MLIRVYSKALTLVWQGEAAQALRKGWNQVPVDRAWAQGLPNGLYFVALKPKRGAQEGLGGPVVKVFMLQ